MPTIPTSKLKNPAILLILLCLGGFIHAENPSVGARTGFSLKDQPGDHLDILSGSRVVGRYMYAYDKSAADKLNLTYKPYLHVFDAEGRAPITKGPGGVFPHHRAIFVGWNKILINGTTYDRWHMSGGAQIHQKFLAQKADAQGATFTSHVDWMGKADQPILAEERTIAFLPAPAPAYAFIDVTSKLKAVAGETQLDGDPEHAGVQFRPANEVDKAETAYVFPKANADTKKDRDYPWVGETFALNGKRYSVVYLNHPSNPKSAIFSAYRDYGRFGAFFKATIPKDAELSIRCGFLVAEGEMPAADWIQKQYNAYAGTSDPVPALTVKKMAQPKPNAQPAPKTAAPVVK